MTSRIDLPGAENFAAYLSFVVRGNLTVEGPEIVDRSYNGEYAKRWIVLLDGKVLGEYYTFGPKPGEHDFGREYRGRVPGYVNEGVVICNQYRHKTEAETPVDTVSLIYSNGHFEPHLMHEWDEKGPGKIIQTPWQRQDNVGIVEFP